MFFTEKWGISKLKPHTGYFYLPVFEQIKSDDVSWRVWALAEQKNILRRFYRTPEQLRGHEEKKLSQNMSLSCYKVQLTESEAQTLKEGSGGQPFLIGSIHFQCTDILSRILFDRKKGQIECFNPFYSQGMPENEVKLLPGETMAF